MTLTFGGLVTCSLVRVESGFLGLGEAFFHRSVAVTAKAASEAAGTCYGLVVDRAAATAVGKVGEKEAESGEEDKDNDGPCKSHGLEKDTKSIIILIPIMEYFLTFTPTLANRPSFLKAF